MPVTLPISRWRYTLPWKPQRSHQNQWIHPRVLNYHTLHCRQRRRSRVCSIICRRTTRCLHSNNAIRHGLTYPQGSTIIMCDNTCAIGIATDSTKQKRSKAIDMRFHWIRDRVRQSQFTIAYYIFLPNKTWPITSPRIYRSNLTSSFIHSWFTHLQSIPKRHRHYNS